MDEPISICTLKRYVADYEMKNQVPALVEVPDEFHKERVAIIGAGPAGLSCGYYLAKAGTSRGLRGPCRTGGMFRYAFPNTGSPTDALHEINRFSPRVERGATRASAEESLRADSERFTRSLSVARTLA